MYFLLFGCLTILLIWLGKRWIPSLHSGYITMAYPLTGLIFAIYLIMTHQTFESSITWLPSLDINFSFLIDGLSLIFFTLISFIGVLVVLYSIFYLSSKENLPKFYSFLTLFMVAMYGITMADNTIILYVFWELTSISSFLLISFWYKKDKALYGALKSFLITVLGGMLMLGGFLALYSISGTNTISKLLELSFDKSPLFYFALLMILIGALTKSAQFPFHIWLPDAMEAPTPISAYLHSATMVKAGIYLLLRFLPIFNDEIWFDWFLIIDGLITMLIGSLFAVRQSDLKGLLAYSTISQLGMIVMMIGFTGIGMKYQADAFAALALTACLLHILNHAVFKAALFMGTGIIDHAAHSRDLSKLGGLKKHLPITFITMAVSAMAMAGIPLFNGFLSKEMFFTVVADFRLLNKWAIYLMIIVLTASTATFVYSFVMIYRTFFGEQHIAYIERERWTITVAPMVLGLLVIALFFVPNIVLDYLIIPAAYIVIGEAVVIKPISAWHGFNLPLIMTLLVFVVGITLAWTGRYRTLFPKKKEMLLNRVYCRVIYALDEISRGIIVRMMTDRLNHYLMFLMTVVLLLLLPGVWLTINNIDLTVLFKGAAFYSVIGSLFIITAALTILKVRSRMTAVILTGAVGYGISLFYILMRAPDLALTQLVIETITTVLFLSCFYHLPDLEKEIKSRLNRWTTIILASGMSLLVMLLLLVSTQYSLFDSISLYYEDAYNLTGGKNIVNAILGDFRAFDTLLEGFVLLITGIGIFMLVKKERNHHERK